MRHRFSSSLLTLGTLSITAIALLANSAGAQSRQIRTAEQVAADAAAFRAGLHADTPFVSADGTIVFGHRCATHDLTEAERAASDAKTAAVEASMVLPSAEELLADPRLAKKNVVNVVFHVIHSGNQGNVSTSAIKDQLRVLNKAFRRHGFRFKIAEITRTNNSNWYNGCAKPATERAMTKALSVDARRTMNIYLCNPKDGSLGWAYLPGSAVTGTTRDGVFLLYSTLPGGSASPYNLGDTGTHEVGHYLGLDHTFAGGCGGNGDRVADTAPEKSPAYGCPAGRDTCSGGGPDPITNFMDYTDDDCMEAFTDGQRAHMKKEVAAHRSEI
ncbi:MAG: zinc metalloprotease [Acidobacteria bacterium]|nr:zinc metalloprotease [Acidobacteriota bacterium]